VNVYEFYMCDRRDSTVLSRTQICPKCRQVAKRKGSEIRDKITSLGGIQYVIALFRSPDATKELKVVATLAIAYILPSYVKSSDSPSSTLGLKIMKCLHFLVTTSDPVTPRGGEISVTEIGQASMMGVFTF
jgi:hypothetical protein